MTTTSVSRGPHVLATNLVLVLTIFLISLCSVSECLMCFQCSASSEDSPCLTDTESMANVSLRKPYEKDCTGINTWDRCMILEGRSDGKLVFYLRDCHNGTYFPDGSQSPLFQTLPSNNQSTCDIIDKKETACYQSCQTDFCNGPRPFEDNTKNCTGLDEDVEGCGALGLFVVNEVILLQMVGAFVSFVVTRKFLFS